MFCRNNEHLFIIITQDTPSILKNQLCSCQKYTWEEYQAILDNRIVELHETQCPICDSELIANKIVKLRKKSYCGAI